MTKFSALKYLSGILVVLLLAACDKFEEDLSPSLTYRLIVNHDTFVTTMNKGIALNVLANDSISSQASVQFGQPSHGKLQPGNVPGSVFYQPDQNFIGKDSISYQVCIGSNCQSAAVIILVKPDSITNPCIVTIIDDNINVLQNGSVVHNILGNDNACNNIPVITKQPRNGKATILANNNLEYVPNLNFTGSDEILYALGGSATGKVTIQVQQPCNLIAQKDSISMLHNNPTDSISIPVLNNDSWCNNGNPVSIYLVSLSSHGSVVVTGSGPTAKIVYVTSTPLQNITDTFQYRICQGGNCSSNTTVTINIK